MSADRPAKGLGMGLSALLGEAKRPTPEGEASPEARGGVRELVRGPDDEVLKRVFGVELR